PAPSRSDDACPGLCETLSLAQSALATNPVAPTPVHIALGGAFHKLASVRAVRPPKATGELGGAVPAPTVVWGAHATHKNPPPLGQNPPSVPASSSSRPYKSCREKAGYPRNFPPLRSDGRAGSANPRRADPSKASWRACPNWETECDRSESKNGCFEPENATGCAVDPQTS